MSFEEEVAKAAIKALLGDDVTAVLVGEVEITQNEDGTPRLTGEMEISRTDATTDIYLTAEQIARALGITTEELSELGHEVGITTEQIASELNLIPRTPPIPPKRGSDEYREVIRELTRLEELGKAIAALNGMWEEYGWRGVLDVMARWVWQIEFHPNATDEIRDIQGVVNIGTILVTAPDQDHLLRMAHDLSREETARGVPPHEAFQRALKRSEEAIRLCQDWLPHFREAFAAALEGGPNVERMVFATLFHGPRREEREALLQAAILLGTAAMGVRNKAALRRAVSQLTPGRVVVDNGEINPQWKTAYKKPNGR